MRRNPKTLKPEKRIGSPRILGIIVPEFEAVVAKSRISLPSGASPILPLRLRPALLAGIAIVERAGFKAIAVNLRISAVLFSNLVPHVPQWPHSYN
jgi:hypothetical protein